MRKILYILALIVFVLCINKINAYTEYKIGDEVTYNEINFYVIKDSSSKEDTVTMLKAEPLTYEELQIYSEGTNAHIQKTDGCGLMGYGLTNDYKNSYVKMVVDAWIMDKFEKKGLKDVRLITYDELTDNLGYDRNNESTVMPSSNGVTPDWIYDGNCSYWIMSEHIDSTTNVMIMLWNGNLGGSPIYGANMVRPVITLKKTSLGDADESIIDDNIDKEDSNIDAKDNIDDNKSNESKATVKVANTYMSSSIIIIILGFIIASVSVLIIYKFSNKKR